MKKVILSLIVLVSVISICRADILVPAIDTDILFNLPDAVKPSVCMFWDATNGVPGSGAVAPFLSIYQVVDFNIGGGTFENSKTAIASLSFDLDKLQEHNVHITYLWQNILKTTIAIWSGYDTENKKIRAGVSATILQVKF